MKKFLLGLLLLNSTVAFAGVDLASTIARIQLKGDGKLWIKMSSGEFDKYCKPGWNGFNLYIQESDPSFPYYYGLIATALSKGQRLYVANISVFNGTSTCDLIKTGYGVTVLNN
ncbi:MAG: hypothetical protein U5M23_05005 [Marinagarivorans sp.]|nr:hypothetical protein [Marinagarivorans sp.]